MSRSLERLGFLTDDGAMYDAQECKVSIYCGGGLWDVDIVLSNGSAIAFSTATLILRPDDPDDQEPAT